MSDIALRRKLEELCAAADKDRDSGGEYWSTVSVDSIRDAMKETLEPPVSTSEIEFNIGFYEALQLVVENAEVTLAGKVHILTAGPTYNALLAKAIEVVKGEQPTTELQDILEWVEMHEDNFMDSGTDSNHGEHTSWERFDTLHAAWLVRHVVKKGLVPYTGEDYSRDRDEWYSHAKKLEEEKNP